MHRSCPLSGVKRTNVGGELHSRLRRNDFVKFFAIVGSEKTRRGKQWGKQTGFDQQDVDVSENYRQSGLAI
jgi:hypothetical protein